jgi:hypothetical protein
MGATDEIGEQQGDGQAGEVTIQIGLLLQATGRFYPIE